MSDYTKLHENVDSWYDSINDVIEHAKPDAYGDAQYLYAYLSCIEEFSNDVE